MSRFFENAPIICVIFPPFFGLEFSRFYFEVLKGEWWYFLSSERSLFLSLGLVCSLLYVVVKQGFKRFLLKPVDFLLLLYCVLQGAVFVMLILFVYFVFVF